MPVDVASFEAKYSSDSTFAFNELVNLEVAFSFKLIGFYPNGRSPLYLEFISIRIFYFSIDFLI